MKMRRRNMTEEPGCSTLKKPPTRATTQNKKPVRWARRLCRRVIGSLGSKPWGLTLERNRGLRRVPKVRHGGASRHSGALGSEARGRLHHRACPLPEANTWVRGQTSGLVSQSPVGLSRENLNGVIQQALCEGLRN